MKTLPIIAALLAATPFAVAAGAAPALAQTTVTRTVTHTRTHEGPVFVRHHTRRVCHVDVRHGRRVRTCRTVRY